MSVLQQGKAVFYHPCNDATEYIKSQAWAESTPTWGAGKVSDALFPTAGGFGQEAEFLSAGGAIMVNAAALSATKFVVAYRDQADSNHGTAKVGTVSGTDITFGAETEFISAGIVDHISAAALSATAFVVAYRDGADSNHGTAKVGTVSGTAITFGAESEFLSANFANDISVAALDSSKFVVAYRDGADSGHGTAKVGTVSGTAITFGAEAEFNSAGGADRIFAAALSATKFAVAYRDNADSNHGTAKVGTVSGTDITFGAEAEFLSVDGVDEISVAALSATKFVVAYQDEADSDHGTVKVGTVSGTAITFGAEAEFASAGSARYISAAALGASSFFVVYTDVADSGHGTAKVGTVSGTDITFGAEKEFLTAWASYTGAAALDGTVLPPASATAFVVTYSDSGDSGHGTANIGPVSGTTIGSAAAASLTASTPGAYGTAAGATKLGFCGWLSKPSA